MTDINQKIEDLEATLVSLKAKAKAQQETTLTPISFESKTELAKALLDGRTFKTPDGYILMYDEETRFSAPFRIMEDGEDMDAMINVWNSYAVLEEINAAPQPWYLNIPEEGIECYVSDDDPNPSCATLIVIIREYNSRLSFPFRPNLSGWKYATPVNEGK
mgnify:CR=1 FL=1